MVCFGKVKAACARIFLHKKCMFLLIINWFVHNELCVIVHNGAGAQWAFWVLVFKGYGY